MMTPLSLKLALPRSKQNGGWRKVLFSFCIVYFVQIEDLFLCGNYHHKQIVALKWGTGLPGGPIYIWQGYI